MKAHLHIASLSVITALCLALAVIPASADSFTLTSNSTVQGFSEPSTIMLLSSGILGLVTFVRRRMIDD